MRTDQLTVARCRVAGWWLGHLTNLTEADGGQSSSRQKQAPEGKPGTETAAGDSLSVSDIKRTEEVQVGAGEIHGGADQFTGKWSMRGGHSS